MRLVRIEVKELFGLFDHVVSLHTDRRITIIHGPNGYGKTAILRMTAGLLGRDYTIFRRIPFTTFTLYFDDGSWVRVRKDAPREVQRSLLPDVETPASFKITIESSSPKNKGHNIVPSAMQGRVRTSGMLADRIDQYIPLARIDREQWFDRNSSRVLSLEDVLEEYSEQLPPALVETRPEPEWLKELRAAIPIRLVDTQRLESRPLERQVRRGYDRTRDSERSVPAVVRYSEEIAGRMQEVIAAYGAKASDLDRSFPSRLLMRPQDPPLEAGELRERLAKLEQRSAQLTTLGFLPEEPHIPPPTEDWVMTEQADVLSIYVKDREQKLQVFDDMESRIRLLTRVIDARFAYKSLRVSAQHGFVVRSSNGATISPLDLSSGEQHELVLLYEMLFKLPPNALVLIDEPEISLHVAWQEAFLKDLGSLVNLSGCDVIIATHSPEIIGENWSLTVELRGPVPVSSMVNES